MPFNMKSLVVVAVAMVALMGGVVRGSDPSVYSKEERVKGSLHAHLRQSQPKVKSDKREESSSWWRHRSLVDIFDRPNLKKKGKVERNGSKVPICHYDADLGQFKKISINAAALKAHIGKHGPAAGNKDMTVEDANTLAGSKDCECQSGYTGDGLNCADIDECTLDTDDCDPNASCTNTVGSFSCECNDFYEGDGVTCEDIDECATDNGGCGDAALYTCINNDGAAPTCIDIIDASDVTFFPDPNDPKVFQAVDDSNVEYTFYGEKDSSGIVTSITSLLYQDLTDHASSSPGRVEFDAYGRPSLLVDPSGMAILINWNSDSNVTVGLTTADNKYQVTETLELDLPDATRFLRKRLQDRNQEQDQSPKALTSRQGSRSLVDGPAFSCAIERPSDMGIVSVFLTECGGPMPDWYIGNNIMWVEVELSDDRLFSHSPTYMYSLLPQAQPGKFSAVFPTKVQLPSTLGPIKDMCKAASTAINIICKWTRNMDPSITVPLCMILATVIDILNPAGVGEGFIIFEYCMRLTKVIERGCKTVLSSPVGLPGAPSVFDLICESIKVPDPIDATSAIVRVKKRFQLGQIRSESSPIGKIKEYDLTEDNRICQVETFDSRSFADYIYGIKHTFKKIVAQQGVLEVEVEYGCADELTIEVDIWKYMLPQKILVVCTPPDDGRHVCRTPPMYVNLDSIPVSHRTVTVKAELDVDWSWKTVKRTFSFSLPGCKRFCPSWYPPSSRRRLEACDASGSYGPQDTCPSSQNLVISDDGSLHSVYFSKYSNIAYSGSGNVLAIPSWSREGYKPDRTVTVMRDDGRLDHLKGRNRRFGGAGVSISHYGNVLAASSIWGYEDPGFIEVFQFNGTEWINYGQEISYPKYARHFLLSGDGSSLLTQERVYAFDGSEWSPKGQDMFLEWKQGRNYNALSISEDGNMVCIRATAADVVGLWGLTQEIADSMWKGVFVFTFDEANGWSLMQDSAFEAFNGMLSSSGTVLVLFTRNFELDIRRYNGVEWISEDVDDGLDVSTGYVALAVSGKGNRIAIAQEIDDSTVNCSISILSYNGFNWNVCQDPIEQVCPQGTISMSSDGEHLVFVASGFHPEGHSVGKIFLYDLDRLG